MLKIRNRLAHRRKSDAGDALLVMSIFFCIFFTLCAGLAIDLTKAVQTKGQYQLMAQDATSAAARNVDLKGNIKPVAVNDVISVYNARFAGVARNDTEVGTYDATSGGRGQCKTVKVPGAGEKTAPYMILTIANRMGDNANNRRQSDSHASWTSEDGKLVSDLSNPDYDGDAHRYYSVRAEIWDTSPNFMMGMWGRPCQQLYTTVSSVTFGSQEDVDDFDDEK